MFYLFSAIAFFLAGVMPELTGFGVATVSMPILSLVMPLSLVIPLVAVISMCATGVVAWQSKTKDKYKRITALVLGSVVGVPIGMFFLDVIDEATLSIIFGVFLVTYSLYGIFSQDYSLPHNKTTGGLIGLFAGFFGAVFNIHGPLVGLYSVEGEDNSKSDVKGLTSAYMFVSGIFTVTGHLLYGRITLEVLYYIAFSLPFLFLGLTLGTKFSHWVKGGWFKYIIYIFVFAVGLSLLMT